MWLFFWADNFDCTVETQAGGGVDFQEKTLQCSSSNTRVIIEWDKRRSIDLEINENMFKPICGTKKEPYVMSNSSECFEINTSSPLSKFVTWLVLRSWMILIKMSLHLVLGKPTAEQNQFNMEMLKNRWRHICHLLILK